MQGGSPRSPKPRGQWQKEQNALEAQLQMLRAARDSPSRSPFQKSAVPDVKSAWPSISAEGVPEYDSGKANRLAEHQTGRVAALERRLAEKEHEIRALDMQLAASEATAEQLKVKVNAMAEVLEDNEQIIDALRNEVVSKVDACALTHLDSLFAVGRMKWWLFLRKR